MNDIFCLIISDIRAMAQIIHEQGQIDGGSVENDTVVTNALKRASALEKAIIKPEPMDGPHSEFENLFEEHSCRSKKVCGD